MARKGIYLKKDKEVIRVVSKNVMEPFIADGWTETTEPKEKPQENKPSNGIPTTG